MDSDIDCAEAVAAAAERINNTSNKVFMMFSD